MEEIKANYKIPDFALSWPRTRIVCSLGPAAAKRETLRELICSGVAVIRINLSHGTPDSQRKYVRLVREVAQELGHYVGIMMDLPGPKYRTGDVPYGELIIQEGDILNLTTAESDGDADAIGVWPGNLHNDVEPGAYILIDDGAAEFTVEKVEEGSVVCRALSDGLLKSRKTISVPGKTLSLDYFTKETVAGIKLAQQLKPDFLALSCVQQASEVKETREMCAKSGFKPQLVAKIELAPAMDNLEEIVAASDAVMVARGDLGIELPLADLPNAQNRIVKLANRMGKPAIIATQMLESMITNQRPTRAEVTDISSAVTEGADALMLSGETAIGKYPVKAVQFMAEIARKSEESNILSHRDLRSSAEESGEISVDNIIAHSAKNVVRQVNAKVIVAFTESGSTAVRVAQFRPDVPILAAVRDPDALGVLSLRWGVVPLVVESLESIEEMFYAGSVMAETNKYATQDDFIVVVMGTPIGVVGNTNLLRIVKVSEPRPGRKP